MSKPSLGTPIVAIALSGALSLMVPQTAAAQVEGAVAVTPHFAFFSDFQANLHDALLNTGLARSRKQPELLFAEGDSCFARLAPSVRMAWNLAVDYYARTVSPGEFLGRAQYLTRMHIAGFDEQLTDSSARRFIGLARAFRDAAAPAYLACRWETQDRQNRAWVTEVTGRLARHEDAIARRLESLYQLRWAGLPMRVDVVQTVSWAGANSVSRSIGGGHLMISSAAYTGNAALELVFHEGSHMLMGPESPFQRALASARSRGIAVPNDLWHVLQFFTTGYVVRQAIEQAGDSYRPLLYSIFDRGTWTPFREVVEREWTPYLTGARPLEAAVSAVLKSLKPAPGS